MQDESVADAAMRVLHVEDDPAFADLTQSYLDRIEPAIDHTVVTTVAAAKRRFDPSIFDAILSDYDLSDGTGIDLLEAVRSGDTEFPFVLFTGKGSEEIASEAISAGVTDYLQKGGGTDKYEMLVNRLRNAVDRHQLSKQVDRSIAALKAASEPIAILGSEGRYVFANSAYASVYGVTIDSLVGSHWESYYPDEEIDRLSNDVIPTVKRDGHWAGEVTVHNSDDERLCRQYVLTHTTDGGHVCIIRDMDQMNSKE